MQTLIYIIIFTTLGSVLAMLGGLILLSRKSLSHTVTHALSAFAAGALLGAAFLDLLPEAFHHFEELGIEEIETTVFMYTLGGVLLFFILERFIHWFHHHHRNHKEETTPLVSLIVFGDGVHNFIDGIVIGATFLVDINLGIITTLAIAMHELPQEIGDFGVLLHEGVAKGKVFLYNFLSQLAAVGGGIVTYFVGSSIEGILPYIIAITSGFFIYIALSDLVPDIHSENKKGFAFLETSMLFVGIFLIFLSVTFLHGAH